MHLSLSYVFIQTLELIKVVYPSPATPLKRYRWLRSCMCSARMSAGKTIHFCVLVVLPSWSRAELDSLHVFCASNVKSIVNSDDFCVHTSAECALIYLNSSEKWAGRRRCVVARECCIFQIPIVLESCNRAALGVCLVFIFIQRCDLFLTVKLRECENEQIVFLYSRCEYTNYITIYYTYTMFLRKNIFKT